MNITIEKSKNKVSLKISDSEMECVFNGISDDNLKCLREQIDEVLAPKPKTTVMVWNPRSKRHDIIEQ